MQKNNRKELEDFLAENGASHTRTTAALSAFDVCNTDAERGDLFAKTKKEFAGRQNKAVESGDTPKVSATDAKVVDKNKAV